VHATAEADFNKAFATLNQLGEGAPVIGTGAFFDGRSERLAALAEPNRSCCCCAFLLVASLRLAVSNRLFYSTRHCEAPCKPSTLNRI
jgi:hypothetical protein